MAELIHRDIKLQFHGSNVDVKFGNDTELSINLKDLSAAITMTTACIGLKTCLKIGGIAAATFVAGKLIKKNWDWINIKSVTAEDKMAVSFSKERKRDFDSIIQNKEMEVYLQQAFASPEESVKKIVEGEPSSPELVDKVTEQLKGCQVSTIEIEDLDVTAQNLYLGTANVTKENAYQFFAAGNPRKGVTAQTFVGKNANVTTNITGGAEFMVVGLQGEEYKESVRTFGKLAGGAIKVKVKGEVLKKTFESEFKPTKTVADVMSKLLKQEGKFFDIYRDGKKLEHNLTIAQAAETGSTVNWEAK